MTLSLGGAVGRHPDTADEVLMRADMALLRAKRLGRARYVAFDPSIDHVATRADLQLEDDLRMSVDERRAARVLPADRHARRTWRSSATRP